MDEQRFKAYVKLSNELLSCSSSDQVQLLEKNRELVDDGLWEVMEIISKKMVADGKQNVANFLLRLRNQLLSGISESPTSAHISFLDYLLFLDEVLQATVKSDSDPKVVYPLLEANLDKLDDSFIDVLQTWASASLLNAKPEIAQGIAIIIDKFSNLISDFQLGNKANNIEIAISGYQKVLTVFTRESNPENWAVTQNHLGIAYCQKIRHNRAENLEKGIEAFQRAVEVCTKEDFPHNWAQTQINLGHAYSDRIHGDRADNLELAIEAFQLALSVNNKQDFPIDWASTQNNLGAVYIDRIYGDRAENFEKAIKAFQLALEVRTKQDCPIDWAGTQNNLGIAYSKRIRGDKTENFQKTIEAYQLALLVDTKEEFPINWASTQNNLGLAYYENIGDDRTENLEKAIEAYQLALEVRTKQNFPYEWAQTQNNLGLAYSDRIDGDRADNLEKAIKAYQLALSVHTKSDFLIDWANTQTNLGNAYSDRIRGDRQENLEKAIEAFQLALEVCTLEANPIDHLRPSRSLGNLHFTQGNWQPAINAYEQAITAVELSRSWAITDQGREEMMSMRIDVYHKLVQAYINIGQSDQAIETVERSKARNLVQLLTNRNLSPKGDVPEDIKAELNRLHRNIPSLERQLQIVIDQLSGNQSQQQQQPRQALEKSQKQLQQQLQQSRQQLDQVLKEINDKYDSSFSITQQVETIPFREIQSLIDEHTAMIEWYVTTDKIITFIVTSHSQHPVIAESSAKDFDDFINLNDEYFEKYYQEKDQWKDNLASRLTELAKLLSIDNIITQIENIFEKVGVKCNRLILIPHWFLHLFPLHALPLSNGDLLIDRFERGVSYAPSSQLLQLTQTQPRPNFNHLFAIQDPTEDLAFTNLEVEIIRSFFSRSTVLARKDAREADVKTHPELSSAHCYHFSCHGRFNPISPLESALILAETKGSDSEASEDGHLTLAEIFSLNLTQSRLVTLSACETGMIDIGSFSDEYINLASGFLFAGSPTVVSSLWTVSDLSTSFLMIKFYENLIKGSHWEAGDVAIALNQAQLWLRNLTGKDCENFLDHLQPHIDKILTQLPPEHKFEFQDALEVFRQKICQKPHPFANPFYWAAFTATGF
ncbi:hypothetical protein BJP34_14830 [Moorena producens PAL-8-15-08-1]|uniref:CHAT domain-containing protein n=1 Tax=Moorena producens PAL-8-15-08-1 TaxID=1458985 RepID=A0A1D8TSD4_9CYAN|nr:CHAT domain-containing tetratricopeptide repeat protein [Moorena producens]AOX00549.1 hypothetical protein BJP34_14830 [Moorena producens PAL-8-15-08-1]